MSFLNSFMKKTILIFLLSSLVLLYACKEPDYREQWTGCYSCNVHSSYGISDTGEETECNYTDTMRVSLAADSSLMVSSIKHNRVWTFLVNESGNIISGSMNSKANALNRGIFFKDGFFFSYNEYGINVSRQYEVKGQRLRKVLE